MKDRNYEIGTYKLKTRRTEVSYERGKQRQWGAGVGWGETQSEALELAQVRQRMSPGQEGLRGREEERREAQGKRANRDGSGEGQTRTRLFKGVWRG
jgi:hypothetical protein